MPTPVAMSAASPSTHVRVATPETAPALPPFTKIPDYRVTLFIDGVADRIRDGRARGIDDATTYAAIHSERLALAQAIGSSAFREAFAQSYYREYNKTRPEFPLSLAACTESINGTLNNRINDAYALANFVMTPLFIEAVNQKAAQPKVAKPYALPQEKIDEMIERFAEDTTPRGVDGITHAQHAMLGHQEGHRALADIYSPQGGLHAVLENALAATWPQSTPQQRQRLAADWLEAREKPARATVEVLKEGGAVYEPVIARIRAVLRPTTTAQSATLDGRAQVKSPLLMDSLG